MRLKKYFLLPIYIFLIAIILGDGNSIVEAKSFRKSFQSPFIILKNTKSNKHVNHIMNCPAHRHGTPQEAMKKLKRLIPKVPSEQKIRIWVCRANQLSILKEFAPLADWVIVNPFIHSSKIGPTKDDLIWPNYNHPCINHIRQLTLNSGGAKLISYIYLHGDPEIKRRKPCFEEIKWILYATIGANFKGVGFSGKGASLPWYNHLLRFENYIQKEAEDIGKANPVNWAKTSEDQPYSALGLKNKLFVVLLNSEYFPNFSNAKELMLPLENTPKLGEIEVCLPANKKIISARTLSGFPQKIIHKDNRTFIKYSYQGAGEIYVFELESRKKTK